MKEKKSKFERILNPKVNIFDIEITFHWSLWIILLWIAITADSPIVLSLMYAIAFASVLAHELGHIWAADVCGMKRHKILLFILGGIANPEEDEDEKSISSKEDFMIYAAGPAITILYLFIFFVGMLMTDSNSLLYDGLLCATVINFVLFAFNMIPVFPLDGGGLLLSGTSWLFNEKVGQVIAHSVSAMVGFLIALFLLANGVIVGGILLAIFSFINILMLLPTVFISDKYEEDIVIEYKFEVNL